MLWLFVQLIALGIFLYYYISKKYSYWSARGVRGPKPFFPFGYTHQKALYRPDNIELAWSREYGKVYGVYTGLLPTLTVTDPELIKQILVKDFHLFINRRYINPYHDIWNKNLFMVEAEDWKRVRSITSPAFTTGKLKSMYPLMAQCIGKLTSYLDGVTRKGGVINTKEAISGFTIDVIASTSFATETNANSDEERHSSPFVYHGLRFFRFNPSKVAACLIFPRMLLNVLGVHHFFHDDSFDFFAQLTRKIVRDRAANPGGPKRPDLVTLMMDSFAYEEDLQANEYEKLTASADLDEAESESKPDSGVQSQKTKRILDENEIVAQCMLFFLAGFETTAATITHSLYELSSCPDLQQRLVNEILEAVEGLDPQKNLAEYYDRLLNHVPYLDAVIKETLRKYPPVIRLERRVGADNYKLGGIPLDKGVLIEIPTYSVHMNPENYPEPERFNPDRFLPENKANLVPYTYLPFGQGPRNCVGMRFAYQEAKLCLATIVQRFRFAPTSKTPTKLTFAKGSPMMTSDPFEIQVTVR